MRGTFAATWLDPVNDGSNDELCDVEDEDGNASFLRIFSEHAMCGWKVKAYHMVRAECFGSALIDGGDTEG